MRASGSLSRGPKHPINTDQTRISNKFQPERNPHHKEIRCDAANFNKFLKRLLLIHPNKLRNQIARRKNATPHRKWRFSSFHYGFEIFGGFGEGYLWNGSALGFRAEPRLGLAGCPVSWSRVAWNREPGTLLSPITCSRRKFVEPDFVRVPATIAITSRGRT
jgi:hypothetical protein